MSHGDGIEARTGLHDVVVVDQQQAVVCVVGVVVAAERERVLESSQEIFVFARSSARLMSTMALPGRAMCRRYSLKSGITSRWAYQVRASDATT
jgi:hypothetical protein